MAKSFRAMKRTPFVLNPFVLHGYRNGDEASKSGKSRQERNSDEKKLPLLLSLLLSLPPLPALTENNLTNFRTTTRGGHVHHTTCLQWSTHPLCEKKEKRFPQECRFCDPVHRVCQETTTVPSEGALASSGIAMVVVVVVAVM